MLFCTCKIHFKINNEKQKLLISKFIFLSKNCNWTLGFGVKIQNSILGQKTKFTFFSILILILNWKSRHFPYTHFFCLNFSIEPKIKTLFLISYLDLSKKRNGTLDTQILQNITPEDTIAYNEQIREALNGLQYLKVTSSESRQHLEPLENLFKVFYQDLRFKIFFP